MSEFDIPKYFDVFSLNEDVSMESNGSRVVVPKGTLFCVSDIDSYSIILSSLKTPFISRAWIIGPNSSHLEDFFNDVSRHVVPDDLIFPKVGDQVILKSDVDRFPHLIVPAGSSGVVTEINDESIRVKMDREFFELDEIGRAHV